MKAFTLAEVHPSWESLLGPFQREINQILEKCNEETLAPHRLDVFRAFTNDLAKVKVVIVGQDPYPGQGVADGLAFSHRPTGKVPASLQNIYKEYVSDLGYPTPSTTDLSQWSQKGVLLLNRVLTNEIGATNAHTSLGWQQITDAIAEELGARDVVAILWGRSAQELSPFFKYRIESVHPSPLSARRGFFGSKPFSEVNTVLQTLKRDPIDWRLQ